MHIIRIPSGIRCRIGFVSDLHNADGSSALKILKAGRPDLIAVVGDLFMGYLRGEERGLIRTQKNIMPFVRGCVDIAPTFISLGNHEWLAADSDMRALAGAGAVILDNRWIEFPLNSGDSEIEDSPKNTKGAGKETGEERGTGTRAASSKQSRRILIGGMTSGMLTDFREFQEQYGKKVPYPHEVRHTNSVRIVPDSVWLDDFEVQDGYKILLCHHPEYWRLQQPMLAERRIDLVLSGHAHGGQIRLFGHGLFAPGQGIFPGYTGGVHRGPHGNMVISRGLSNTAPWPIPRLFNPPEVVFVDLGHTGIRKTGNVTCTRLQEGV